MQWERGKKCSGWLEGREGKNVVGLRCFLLGLTKMFSLQNEKKTEGESVIFQMDKNAPSCFPRQHWPFFFFGQTFFFFFFFLDTLPLPFFSFDFLGRGQCWLFFFFWVNIGTFSLDTLPHPFCSFDFLGLGLTMICFVFVLVNMIFIF